MFLVFRLQPNLLDLISAADIISVLAAYKQQQLKGGDAEEMYLVTLDIIGLKFNASRHAPQEQIAQITEQLLPILQMQNVTIISSALNSVFDIYSDEQYDEVFKSRGIL